MWETAIWLKASQREVVKTDRGKYVILRKDQISAKDEILANNLLPCTIEVRADGRFKYSYTKEPSNFSIYQRPDTDLNEKALQSAYPDLIKSYHPKETQITN